LQEAFSAERNAVESVAHRNEILLAGLGQQKTLRLAVEEAHAELGFERLDLMTHGPLRHEKLGSRAGEAFMPGRSLEGAQRIQRGQALPHEKN
jgi:hypothetical protein